jgi:hypothetical protein
MTRRIFAIPIPDRHDRKTLLVHQRAWPPEPPDHHPRHVTRYPRRSINGSGERFAVDLAGLTHIAGSAPVVEDLDLSRSERPASQVTIRRIDQTGNPRVAGETYRGAQLLRPHLSASLVQVETIAISFFSE